MNSTLARIDLGTEFKIKGGGGIGNTFSGSIRDYVSLLLPNALVFAGIILLILIVVASIGLMSSAGNPEKQQKNKGVLTNAAIGFIIILASYWIIQIIQTITGVRITSD